MLDLISQATRTKNEALWNTYLHSRPEPSRQLLLDRRQHPITPYSMSLSACLYSATHSAYESYLSGYKAESRELCALMMPMFVECLDTGDFDCFFYPLKLGDNPEDPEEEEVLLAEHKRLRASMTSHEKDIERTKGTWMLLKDHALANWILYDEYPLDDFIKSSNYYSQFLELLSGDFFDIFSSNAPFEYNRARRWSDTLESTRHTLSLPDSVPNTGGRITSELTLAVDLAAWHELKQPRPSLEPSLAYWCMKMLDWTNIHATERLFWVAQHEYYYGRDVPFSTLAQFLRGY